MGTIAVAWWNLENLFDTDDDPISQDFEFTKANGWTDEVYAAKRANLAAVLNQLHDGNGPELLGVAEVEGDNVFAQLLEDTGNPHLKVATDPNPPTDLRGIDASIAYDERKLRVVDQASFIVHLRYPPATSSKSSSRSQKPTTGWWSSPATGRRAGRARSTANPPA